MKQKSHPVWAAAACPTQIMLPGQKRIKISSIFCIVHCLNQCVDVFQWLVSVLENHIFSIISGPLQCIEEGCELKVQFQSDSKCDQDVWMLQFKSSSEYNQDMG